MIQKNHRLGFLLLLLTLLLFTLSGCALLEVPLRVVEGGFSLVSQLLKIADGLPKPPPGVFF